MDGQDFSHRSTQAELMDGDAISFDEFHSCLNDLAIVNTWTLAYRPTLSWLCHVTTIFKTAGPLTILDVGSGGGDMLRKIARWASRRNTAVNLTGVDLNPWSKKSADRVSSEYPQIEFETSDIFSFEPSRQADFIISSLFTHHLNDTQLVQFLQWMERHAKYGWFINDLHRHPLPYFFVKYAFRLLRPDRMVQHDGPISVARAFTKNEWIKFLTAAGIPLNQIKIEWFFPFRYCVSRCKS